MICVCLYEHGNLYLQQRQIESAETAFDEMLTSIPEGDQELFALARYGLARVAAARGDIAEAKRLGEASITVLEAMGHRNAQEIRSWLTILADKRQ